MRMRVRLVHMLRKGILMALELFLSKCPGNKPRRLLFSGTPSACQVSNPLICPWETKPLALNLPTLTKDAGV